MLSLLWRIFMLIQRNSSGENWKNAEVNLISTLSSELSYKVEFLGQSEAFAFHQTLPTTLFEIVR
ncbi:hypothetical protein T09_8006 [Trichinella sp. T9]|nr:hypothetical protein T09_8006 [Trichinella sp. T9]